MQVICKFHSQDELFFLYEDFIPPLSYVDELQKISEQEKQSILFLNSDDVSLPCLHINWDLYGYNGPLNIYHLHRFHEKLTDKSKVRIIFFLFNAS